MASKQGRTSGSSLFGGLAGAGVGLLLGGLLGAVLGRAKQDDQSLFGMVDACAAIFFVVIGAAVGGVIGAIAGAVLGAELPTSHGTEKRADGQADTEQELPGGPPKPQESKEAELVRLKARIAELEERQIRGGEAEPQNASPSTDITTGEKGGMVNDRAERRVNNSPRSPPVAPGDAL